jgi:hypothetical protein
VNRIITSILALFLLSALPAVTVSALEAESQQESLAAPEAQEINVSVSGNALRVTGAAKMTMKIYYLTGTQAASYSIESDDQQVYTDLAKGVYVVKVGKFVRKLTIS